MEITSRTKVAALLEAYPQLEDVLIAMAPPFRKLKNPILRRSVAKVASLRQAAAVAGIPLATFIDDLRGAVGQPPLTGEQAELHDYFGGAPAWFDEARIAQSIDERADIDADQMPLVPLLAAAKALGDGEILELVTTFLPAPGIDRMRAKGYLAWSRKGSDELVRSYFTKAG
jgi:hypothetical protein